MMLWFLLLALAGLFALFLEKWVSRPRKLALGEHAEQWWFEEDGKVHIVDMAWEEPDGPVQMKIDGELVDDDS